MTRINSIFIISFSILFLSSLFHILSVLILSYIVTSISYAYYMKEKLEKNISNYKFEKILWIEFIHNITLINIFWVLPLYLAIPYSSYSILFYIISGVWLIGIGFGFQQYLKNKKYVELYR